MDREAILEFGLESGPVSILGFSRNMSFLKKFHRDIIVVLTPIFTVTCYHSVGYPLHSTGCPTVIIDDFTRAMPKTQHSKQMRAKKRHLVWSLRLCDKRSNSSQWNAMLLQFVSPHSYRCNTPWKSSRIY